MFTSVGRRLALLNVLVVITVIAITGAGTWLLLRESLNREADNALADRITSARASLDNPSDPSTTNGAAALTPTPANQIGKYDDDDDDDEDRHEILTSGDTLIYVFDQDGHLQSNLRDVTFHDIPDDDSIDIALEGDIDTRFVTTDNERVRVRTEPVLHDGEVVGAIQAVRSEREHDAELRLVGIISLIGVGVGMAIALPAGLYLTRRAMAPINDVFQRQRTFVSDASHELRTPLTILRANAEMLNRTPNVTRDEIHAELGHMIDEMDTMSMLVDELLEISRLDHPDQASGIQPMPLAPTIERVRRLMSPLASAAGVDLVIRVTDVSIRGNAALVERVLRIVLDNAIKYTPEGGTVTLATARNRGSATIEIRDTGIGIAPEDQPHVFDRFFRADKARTRSTGTGLGLAIARSLVTTLNGTIYIESTPGTGTCIRITLPLAD